VNTDQIISKGEFSYMMSKKFVSLAVAATVLAGVAITPGVSVAQTPATIRIYSSLPLTGSSAAQTTTVVNAMTMALEQNTKGGLVCNGKFKIDYVSLDDATAAAGKWDAAKEQENANKAVADPDAMVYLGTFNSGAAQVSIPILNQAKLVMISPANTYPGLTKKWGEGEPDKFYPNKERNYTRVAPADDIQGAIAAKWARSLGARNVFILHDTETYGKGVADSFRGTAKAIGLKELGYEGIDGKAQDYNALATKIKATNPALIYYGGITQNNAGQLLKDIRKAGIKSIFMGADGILEEAFIKAAGADIANGVLATTGGVPRAALPAKGRKFYVDYAAKFKSQPETYAIYGYESMSVAIAAINRACVKDRAGIRDAVFGTKNYNGVLGRWSFDAGGDTSLSGMVGNRIVKGKWTETGALRFP
jgi:branched-chain amino acid transport system substrate-binding protein